TVERGTVHSLHAYFLRPGDPTVPILYTVDRIRDGKSFTTRRVVALQRGKAIFNLAASFHVAEDGPEHEIPMPDVPAPEDLPTMPCSTPASSPTSRTSPCSTPRCFPTARAAGVRTVA